jgi:hypothetical protein
LSDQTLDLVQLNTAILEAPGQLSSELTLQTLAAEDPKLEFLCPLAKALYLLEINQCKSRDAILALESIWLIDDSLIFKGERWAADDNVEGREIVAHSIGVMASGEMIRLEFVSEADLLFCSDEYKNLITADTVAAFLRDKSEIDAFANPGHLITWLASKTEAPIGYPEGEDEPLCGISHHLASINGIDVNGPTMNCGYHETTVDGISDEWEWHSRPEKLCWLHALDAELADQLGIGATSPYKQGRSSSRHENHPIWLAEGIDIEAAWLDAEQLQKSYSTGCRLRIKEAPIRLALGCGEDWTPKTQTEEEESCDPSQRVYPLVHPPILSIDISPDSQSLPDEAGRLHPYLLKLAEIARNWCSTV